MDPEQHEAALIDGASRFQRLLHVDLPAILPTITITLILRCGQLMGIGFDKVYLMQNDLNLRASEVISTYVYKVAFRQAEEIFPTPPPLGCSTPSSIWQCQVLVNFISRRVSDTSLW